MLVQYTGISKEGKHIFRGVEKGQIAVEIHYKNINPRIEQMCIVNIDYEGLPNVPGCCYYSELIQKGQIAQCLGLDYEYNQFNEIESTTIYYSMECRWFNEEMGAGCISIGDVHGQIRVTGLWEGELGDYFTVPLSKEVRRAIPIVPYSIFEIEN